MMKTLVALAALVVVAVAVRLSVYTVDAAEYAYVTLLGEPIATFDGADDEGGAGLHAGWPWPVQSVQRLDRRLQQFDLPATELLTHEGKTIDKMLLVEAYVCWKIADARAVDLFVRRIGTVERASAILEPRIRSELGAAIGQMKMDDLVSTKKGVVDEKVADLHHRLEIALKKKVRDDYGIELVDVRLRRFSHPAQVRESIFERIKSERSKEAAKYISDGDLQARNIDTQAEEQAKQMLTKARYDEIKIKGDADADAMRIRNEAHQQDPKFYAFLKQMEKLQSILGDNRTVLLLSTHRPLFEGLFNPPGVQPAPKKSDGPADKKGGPG
jgi:modulator of FtsH protease HflC